MIEMDEWEGMLKLRYQEIAEDMPTVWFSLQ